MIRRLALAAVCLFVVACGSDKGPTTPTSTAQVAGVWRGTFVETSVVGGECFASVFPAGIGSSVPVSVAFTQNGSTVDAAATVTSTGSNYIFAGAVGQSALTLNGSSCSACNVIGATCPGSTAKRDIKIQTAGFNGTVNGSSLTGTESETYNVFVAGTSAAVGAVTFSYSFTLTKS